jgi:hypothetical protein
MDNEYIKKSFDRLVRLDQKGPINFILRPTVDLWSRKTKNALDTPQGRVTIFFPDPKTDHTFGRFIDEAARPATYVHGTTTTPFTYHPKDICAWTNLTDAGRPTY